MKESISNAMVFTIVLSVVAICGAIVFFSMGYSKTFKIAGKIVDIIEDYKGFSDSNTAEKNEINSYLKSVGYSTQSNNGTACPTLDGQNAINTISMYKYCIYEHSTSKGKYYAVKVYMTFNFPIIGDFYTLQYSITSETRTFLNPD